MALHMRDQLIKAVLAHANGEIAKHKANVEVYLEHPMGIGEHSDITEAIQVELDKIARYHDQIEVLNHYFLKRQMASISEVLLSINQVLSGYDSEVKKAGTKVTTLQINGKERVDIREDIKQKLDKAGIKYEQKKLPGSGFEGIEIEESSSSVYYRK